MITDRDRLRSGIVNFIVLIISIFSVTPLKGAEKSDPVLVDFRERCSIAFCVIGSNEEAKPFTIEMLKGPKLEEGNDLVRRARAVLRAAIQREKPTKVTGVLGFINKDRPDKLLVQIIDANGNLSRLKKNISDIRSVFAGK